MKERIKNNETTCIKYNIFTQHIYNYVYAYACICMYEWSQ